jgi:hypothetical protein
MRFFSLIPLLLVGSFSTVQAFDFGAAMQAVAPLATQMISPSTPVAPQVASNPLIRSLTSALGVTPLQAVGGTAAILNDTKSKMSPADFSTLTKQVPQVNTLLSAVPTGLLGNAGGVGSAFSMLGMDASMVDKFSPLILKYLQDGAKPSMDTLLSTVFAQ